MCNCRWTEFVIGVVVVVFTIFPLLGSASKWIVVVAGFGLLLHAAMCKNCKTNVAMAPVKKAKKRKRK